MCLNHILGVGLAGYGNGLNIVDEEEERINNVCQVSKFINGLDGGGFFLDG